MRARARGHALADVGRLRRAREFVHRSFSSGSIAEVVTDRLVIRYQEPMRHTIDGEIYDSTAKLGRVAASEGGEDVVVIETGPYIKFIVS